MITKDTYIATHRFGFAPNLNDIQMVQNNAKAALLKQINDYQATPNAYAKLPTHQTIIKTYKAHTKKLRSIDKSDSAAKQKAKRQLIKEGVKQYNEEVEKRITWAAQTPTPFAENLVHFWSDHFTVSAQKREIIPLVGAYEREAIRPHIFGNFYDMAMAAILHPAMLIYLDNISSFGPNSIIGKRRNKGLNENLAREVLELHILGVNGGYSQKDVQELAKVLTGWTIALRNAEKSDTTQFVSFAHEGGIKTILGKTYQGQGKDTLRKVIFDLCHKPATAKFIATKMAHYFVSDTPSDALIRDLAKTFQQTKGDLRKVTEKLIEHPDAWHNDLNKIKTPWQFIVSILRATNNAEAIPAKKIMLALNHLGQRPFYAPSPAGWKNDAQTWLSPEAMIRRVDLGYLAAGNMDKKTDMNIWMQNILGNMADANTRFAIQRAPSRREAFTMLFASPAFQRK